MNPFKSLPEVECPSYLARHIHDRIAALERRAVVLRVGVLVVAATMSFVGFVASCVYAWNSAMASGFSEYISIIFSDSGAALSYSRELALAILESSPALGVALALTAGLGLVWSLASLIRKHQNQSSYGYSL